MKIVVIRDWQDENQTLGKCTIYNEEGKPAFSCVSLERGWRDNQRNISCVPEGEYKVVLEWSPKFKQNLWELKGVPNRSECKFHAANYWYQLNGCIALGQKIKDINGDGYNDVTSSRLTMKQFHSTLSGLKEVTLEIKTCKC